MWLGLSMVNASQGSIRTPNYFEGAFESRKGIPCSSLGACDHRIVAVAPIPITLPGLEFGFVSVTVHVRCRSSCVL